MSDAVRDSIVVAADPDTIFDVIADFEAYPEWQSETSDVEILETDEDGWATRVRMVVDARVMQARMVLAYSYTDTEMHWHLVEGEGLKRNDGSYRLEPREDGTTLVTYEIEVVPTAPVPGFLRRQAAKRIAEAALQAMKRRVEARV